LRKGAPKEETIVNTKNTKKKSVVKTKNVNTLGFGKNYDKHKKHTFLNHETEKAETPYTELYVTRYIFLWNPHGNRPIFKMKTVYPWICVKRKEYPM
jgi:hypothetical protein